MWCGAISCSITVISSFAHLTRKGVVERKYLLLAHKARNKGMTKNLQDLSTVDMDHKKGQKWAEDTSKLHCSSHACARSIIFYFLPSMQMLTIPSYAPNMCVYGDRDAKSYL